MPHAFVALFEFNPLKPHLSLKGNGHFGFFEADSDRAVVLLLNEDLVIEQKRLIFHVDFPVGPFSQTLHGEEHFAWDIHSGLMGVYPIGHSFDHVETRGFNEEFRLD